MKIDKRTGDVHDDGCYEYMRLTHTLAVCCGLPITRRRIDDVGKSCDRDLGEVRGIKYHSIRGLKVNSNNSMFLITSHNFIEILDTRHNIVFKICINCIKGSRYCHNPDNNIKIHSFIIFF